MTARPMDKPASRRRIATCCCGLLLLPLVVLALIVTQLKPEDLVHLEHVRITDPEDEADPMLSIHVSGRVEFAWAYSTKLIAARCTVVAPPNGDSLMSLALDDPVSTSAGRFSLSASLRADDRVELLTPLPSLRFDCAAEASVRILNLKTIDLAPRLSRVVDLAAIRGDVLHELGRIISQLSFEGWQVATAGGQLRVISPRHPLPGVAHLEATADPRRGEGEVGMGLTSMSRDCAPML